jgi:uncharacterized membrane protein (GlpM family)
MSALGQKQTYALQNGMSALHPIATSIAFFSVSALGQKRTHALQQTIVYSMTSLARALPPFRACAGVGISPRDDMDRIA